MIDNDDRSKMILGAALLAEARANPQAAGKLLYALRGDLTRATQAADEILKRLADDCSDDGGEDGGGPDIIEEMTQAHDKQRGGDGALEL